MSWFAIVIGVVLLIATVVFVLWLIFCNCDKCAREAEMAAARARSTQARHEVEQLSISFHHAVTDAVERLQRDHQSK